LEQQGLVACRSEYIVKLFKRF